VAIEARFRRRHARVLRAGAELQTRRRRE
jgi:hypothetical protein